MADADGKMRIVKGGWKNADKTKKIRIKRENADSIKRKKNKQTQKGKKKEREKERKKTLRSSSSEPLSKSTCIGLSLKQTER